MDTNARRSRDVVGGLLKIPLHFLGEIERRGHQLKVKMREELVAD